MHCSPWLHDVFLGLFHMQIACVFSFWLSELRQGAWWYSQQWQSPVDAMEKCCCGREGPGVLLFWMFLGKQLWLLLHLCTVNKLIFWHLCCRKHQRKAMRKFNTILITLCHFLPTSHLILYQRTPHWRFTCVGCEGEKICWSLLLGFHCELIFLKTLSGMFLLCILEKLQVITLWEVDPTGDYTTDYGQIFWQTSKNSLAARLKIMYLHPVGLEVTFV